MMQTQISGVLKRNPFIIPSAPFLKRQPPTGPQWLHEIKFDGWRAQLQKAARCGRESGLEGIVKTR
jgi:ATP-dependent DNA ligase